MIKVLLAINVAINGIVVVTTTGVSSINFQYLNEASTQAERKEYPFEPQSDEKILRHGDIVVFTIDNINLTSIGITDVDKLHEYNVINIPDIYMRVENIRVKTDQWNPKQRNIGTEPWHFLRSITHRGAQTEIYTSASLWYDNNSNALMMRLSYRAIALYYGERKTFAYGTGAKLVFS